MELRDVSRRLMELIYVLPLIVLLLWKELGLTIKEAFFILIGCSIAISLYKTSGAMERGIILKMRSNPNNEEEVKTSGAGAFAGMIAGGTIGLLFGPAGVIIGGIIGAILGNQAEYESLKAERERKETKKT